MKNRKAGLFLTVLGLGLTTAALGQSGPTEWKDWGGDVARTHYSRLNQINAANVSQLRPVWMRLSLTRARSSP